MSSELYFLTIAEAARLIQSRKISPVELTQTLLERVEAIDPQLNAYITVTADLALKQARKTEAEVMRGHYKGPLHGIPIGLKDIYNTAGILTSGHSKICIDHIPSENATATDNATIQLRQRKSMRSSQVRQNTLAARRPAAVDVVSAQLWLHCSCRALPLFSN